jgi:bacillolysin
VDCRVAVIKAASDLHGASSAEVTAARAAFDAVGILGEQSGNYEVDVNVNPGQEFLLAVGGNFNGIFLHTPEGSPIRTLTNRSVLSKPSISDDGSEIVYVSTDNHIYYITINWNTNQTQEQRLSNTAIWRNVIISKDGTKVAALTKEIINEIVVFHFGASTTSSTFELYNPTFTQGVNTGDVLYADAMEFDLTGEYIMYDAENAIKSNSSGTINYWDIGIIKVWNNQSGTFSFGAVEKLFPALPNGISIGNPTSPKTVLISYLLIIWKTMKFSSYAPILSGEKPMRYS